MPDKKKYAIGVDFGGTSIKFGIVSQAGKIVRKMALETKADEGPKAVIKQILKGIRELSKDEKYKISGIGVGSPGIISIKKGTVENPPNIRGWGKVHLGRIIEKETGIKTFVENDANTAALGELIFGTGKLFNSFVMVTLGTGVGGGLIFDRKLYRGETGGAGEIGHVTINMNGKRCNCGSYGCIEAYTGINYLIDDVRELLGSRKESKIYEILENDLDLLTPKIISMAAESEDEFAISVINEVGNNLGCALATVCNILDVTTIIIGGGVAGFGKRLFEAIEKTARERVLKSLAPRVRVMPAKLNNDAGINVSSALVFYKK
ncbi:MAG: ROK family protein [Ignavibacteriaceae bacterium]|jgi:glucokinase|nr:ROK family protein [Ignavibacteriaceae bacterium]